MSSSSLIRSGAQIWTWRGFIGASVVRELRARYSRSLFGWLWLLLPPLVLIAIYTLVFSKLMRGAGLPDHGPYTYSIYLCAGMLTWQWFSELLSRIVGLFGNYAPLIKKTAVPWYALLAVDLLVTSFGLAIQMGLFALLLAAVDQWPGWRILIFVPLLAVQALLAIGLGLGLAVFQVFFRDVGLMIPLLLQVWFWMTPIVYPIAALPAQFQPILHWNIVTPLVQGYQSAALLPDMPVNWRGVAVVAVVGGLALLASLRLMRRNFSLIRDEI